jgi:hypothetical protein
MCLSSGNLFIFPLSFPIFCAIRTLVLSFPLGHYFLIFICFLLVFPVIPSTHFVKAVASSNIGGKKKLKGKVEGKK